MERIALPPLAEYAGWLALLWLAAACVEAWSGWFTAFQAAASASVLFAVAAWLDRTALSPVPADFADPHSLRRFALGLAALAVVWVALRLALRGRAAARLLLEPPWPAPDWVLLGGLVLGQLGLAAAGVTPGVLHELGPAAGGFGEGVFHLTYSQATDGASWLLVGLLSAALAGSLWDLRGAAWETLVLLGLLGIAVTVPVLGAGSWAPELATASALRWDLA